MLKQRDKLLLSLLAAAFAALTLGDGLGWPVLDWWCIMFPEQSPVTAAAGGETVYRLWLLEWLQGLI